MRQNLPTCSFCGASQDETRKIVAGPRESGICAECVEAGSRMLLGDANMRPTVFRFHTEGSLSCSFCGKRRKDVWQLLVGAKHHVCSECLGVCNAIFGDDGNQIARERAAEIDRLSGRPLPASGATLSGYMVSARHSFLKRILDRVF
jgi:ATP-dependent protease Clp ATPase subunit